MCSLCDNCIVCCLSVKPGAGVKASVLLRRHGAGGHGEELDCMTLTKKFVLTGAVCCYYLADFSIIQQRV